MILFTFLPTRPIQSRGKGAGSQDMEGQLSLCHELPARYRGGEGPEQEQGQFSCAGVPDAPTPHQEPEERYPRALGPRKALRERGKEEGSQLGLACLPVPRLTAYLPHREKVQVQPRC